jgi:hypothetical protein
MAAVWRWSWEVETEARAAGTVYWPDKGADAAAIVTPPRTRRRAPAAPRRLLRWCDAWRQSDLDVAMQGFTMRAGLTVGHGRT